MVVLDSANIALGISIAVAIAIVANTLLLRRDVNARIRPIMTRTPLRRESFTCKINKESREMWISIQNTGIVSAVEIEGVLLVYNEDSEPTLNKDHFLGATMIRALTIDVKETINGLLNDGENRDNDEISQLQNMRSNADEILKDAEISKKTNTIMKLWSLRDINRLRRDAYELRNNLHTKYNMGGTGLYSLGPNEHDSFNFKAFNIDSISDAENCFFRLFIEYKHSERNKLYYYFIEGRMFKGDEYMRIVVMD